MENYESRLWEPRECERDNGGDEEGDWELGRFREFERKGDQLSLKVVCVGLQGAQEKRITQDCANSVAQNPHKLYNYIVQVLLLADTWKATYVK